MKTLTTEQYNALPEEQKQYWDTKRPKFHGTQTYYTQVRIPLEDAERVIKELILSNPQNKAEEWHNIGLIEAINQLQELKP